MYHSRDADLPKPKPETLIEEINVVLLTSLRKDITAPSKLQKKKKAFPFSERDKTCSSEDMQHNTLVKALQLQDVPQVLTL